MELSMKIGVIIESFKKNFEESIDAAVKIGAQGIQAYATFGFLELSSMNREKTDYVKDYVTSNGLEFSAICGDYGKGFANEAENRKLIDDSKRILDLAKELGCDIVTTHIGTVPREENATKEVIRTACRELAQYADSIGSCFAVETGPEPAAVLGDFLDSLGAMGVRVNYDPANLAMVSCDDPVAGVYTLKKYIVHTHAKDGVNLGPKKWHEMPLGKGSVDFDKYLCALYDIGYNGYLTIEREVGDTPEADIVTAKEFLIEKINRYGF